jgi:hypothetical protein
VVEALVDRTPDQPLNQFAVNAARLFNNMADGMFDINQISAALAVGTQQRLRAR